mmetsp:Transcript_64702/g.127880  ORF Transcript_64702/g.127880 Transcript_64702/m.127880 type:complete len:119 (-) Transcript_64702:2393-2749(-)
MHIQHIFSRNMRAASRTSSSQPSPQSNCMPSSQRQLCRSPLDGRMAYVHVHALRASTCTCTHIRMCSDGGRTSHVGESHFSVNQPTDANGQSTDQFLNQSKQSTDTRGGAISCRVSSH